MQKEDFRYYCFGEFKLDSRRRVLTKNDAPASISAKNFDLLLELVKNEGRILSHDELLDSVWEGTFVEQSNLKKGISALRQILGETPESSNYIKTIPRKGYAFVSSVEAFTNEPEIIHVTTSEVIIEEEIIEESESKNEPKSLTAIPQNNFRKNYKKFLMVGISILLLGILAFGFRGYFSKQGKRFSAENVKITKLTNDGNCSDASISADGNFILCGVKTKEGSTLITRQVSAKSQVQLLPPQKDINFWAYKITPDGNSVYFMLHSLTDPSRDGLYQIPFLGGMPRKINNSALHLTFSPDGKRMGFVRITPVLNQILTANLDGSDEQVLTEYGDGSRIWGLNWSPDGKSLLCSARQMINEKFVGYVDEISLSNGAKNKLFENDRMIVSATWMPDKTSIILGMREPNSEVRQIWQFFPGSKELIRVTNDNNIYRFPVLNQAGTIISVSQETTPSEVFLGEIGNDKLTPLTNTNATFGEIIKTKDGLLYSSYEGGSESAWIMDSNGGNKRQITDGKDGISLGPKVSNDGNSIVYSSMRNGAKDLWRINIDGSGLTQLTKSNEEIMWGGKLLSDNQTLILHSSLKGYYNLWKQNPSGEKVLLAEKVGVGWDVSPDDKLIVYDKYNESTKLSEIVVQSIENNQILQSIPVQVIDILKWNDANSFIYETKKEDKYLVYKQTLDRNPAKLIFEYTETGNDRVPSFEILQDGKHFVVIRGKYITDAVTIKIDESK
ncbi:MAG: winged helix-turn-helix domain-containing protein [Pyrinomonadaceae bacterium]|nr:winged helix-turn-helix domain-containing protein [Pyrinomonadaceae bacterium]